MDSPVAVHRLPLDCPQEQSMGWSQVQLGSVTGGSSSLEGDTAALEAGTAALEAGILDMEADTAVLGVGIAAEVEHADGHIVELNLTQKSASDLQH